MLQSLREETEGKPQMLLSPRKNGLTSLFKEVRVFKVAGSSAGLRPSQHRGGIAVVPSVSKLLSGPKL